MENISGFQVGRKISIPPSRELVLSSEHREMECMHQVAQARLRTAEQ